MLKTLVANFLKPSFLALSIILMFYIWQINYGKEPYNQQAPDGWYNLLTDGLLQGKLSLPIEPKKELLELEDPYDPAQNNSLRLHDMSLYKGKYYMYFGISPAILVYLPYRLLTGEKIKDEYVILLFMAGVLVFSALILKHFQKHFFPIISDWKIAFSISVIGICNITYQILKRPMMYEVAISSGLFFLTGGLLFSIKYLFKSSKLMLFLSGLFLSLSVGCRPHFLAIGIFIFYFFTLKTKFKDLAYFIIPYSFCIFLLGLYNYLRFDNFFEFGMNYQLPGFNIKKIQMLSPEFILPGIYYYLFQIPGLNADLPFFHMMPTSISYLLPKKFYNIEAIFGILPGIPFIIILFIAPILYFIEKLNTCKINCKKNKLIINSLIQSFIFFYFFKFLIPYLNPLEYRDILNNIKTMHIFLIHLFIILINIIIWLKNIRSNCHHSCLQKSDFPVKEFNVIFLSACSNLLFLTLIAGVTIRFLADFVTLFLLSSCIIWFYFESNLSSPTLKKTLTIVAIATGIISIIIGLAIGTEAYFNNMKIENYLLYSDIDLFCKPLKDYINKL